MLDPSRYSLDAATVGFRKRMKQSVDMASFDRALQSQTESIKVRRELKETPITEIHVMGGGMYGIANDEKTNTYARQQRQINGYVLRSFKANAGPIILPPKHGEGLMATPMNMGQRQYGGYNSVVGNYVSSFTEPLQAPLDNNTILLGRAGIAAANESASNPYARLQFLMNLQLTQQQINQNQQEFLESRQYNVQKSMATAIRDAELEQYGGRKKAAVMRELEARRSAGEVGTVESMLPPRKPVKPAKYRNASTPPLSPPSSSSRKRSAPSTTTSEGIPIGSHLGAFLGAQEEAFRTGAYASPGSNVPEYLYQPSGFGKQEEKQEEKEGEQEFNAAMALYLQHAREFQSLAAEKQGPEVRGDVYGVTLNVDGAGDAQVLTSTTEKLILAGAKDNLSADQRAAEESMYAKTGYPLGVTGPFTPTSTKVKSSKKASSIFPTVTKAKGGYFSSTGGVISFQSTEQNLGNTKVSPYETPPTPPAQGQVVASKAGSPLRKRNIFPSFPTKVHIANN